MSKKPARQILPVWGYVLLNAIVLLVFAGVYLAAEWYALRRSFVTAGLMPILTICWLCFLLVSVYDAVFDRLTAAGEARRQLDRDRRPAPPPSRELPKRTD